MMIKEMCIGKRGDLLKLFIFLTNGENTYEVIVTGKKARAMPRAYSSLAD